MFLLRPYLYLIMSVPQIIANSLLQFLLRIITLDSQIIFPMQLLKLSHIIIIDISYQPISFTQYNIAYILLNQLNLYMSFLLSQLLILQNLLKYHPPHLLHILNIQLFTPQNFLLPPILHQFHPIIQPLEPGNQFLAPQHSTKKPSQNIIHFSLIHSLQYSSPNDQSILNIHLLPLYQSAIFTL